MQQKLTDIAAPEFWVHRLQDLQAETWLQTDGLTGRRDLTWPSCCYHLGSAQ